SHGNNLCASAVQVFRAFPPQSFNPTTTSWWEGRPVVRSPKQLRLHRTLEGLGWTDAIDEFNDAARLKGQSVPEPILITTNGTVLAGFGRWRVALFELRHEIPCIEYPLSEDESLQFILSHHQTRCGWNAQQSANHDRLASRSEGFSALSLMLGYFPGYVESRIQLTAEPGLAFHRNSAKTGGLSDSCAEPKMVHRPPGPLAFLLLDDALQETQAAVHKGAHGRPNRGSADCDTLQTVGDSLCCLFADCFSVA